MIRTLVRDRRARRFALTLVVVPCIACSSVTARLPHRVSPEIANAARQFAQTDRTPADLPPGARIRYNAADHWYGRRTARVSRATADTIWLESGQPVPVAGLGRLEISLTGDTKSGQLMWGTLIGAGVGAIYGASVDPSKCGDACESGGAPDLDSPGFWTTVFGVYGAFVGLVGTAILAPNEQWERVTLPHERVRQ